MKALDRKALDTIRNDMNLALAAVAEEHGIRIVVGRCKYSSERADFNIEVATIGEDGDANTAQVVAFKANARYYGLAPEDLGREFGSNGTLYAVCGAAPRARKFPILAKNLQNGKTYKFSATAVQRAFASQG